MFWLSMCTFHLSGSNSSNRQIHCIVYFQPKRLTIRTVNYRIRKQEQLQKIAHIICTVYGGVILEKKNWALGKLCQIVSGPQFQNFTLKCCFLTWRWAPKNVDFYPKVAKKKKCILSLQTKKLSLNFPFDDNIVRSCTLIFSTTILLQKLIFSI